MEFMGIASAAALLLAGWLIGATGIGGVLVVPALTQFEGLPLKQAIAASALAFAFPGAAALWWLRRAPGAGASLIALVAGAVPGAAVGALLVHSVDVRWLLAAMAALAITTGVRGLRKVGLRDPDLLQGRLERAVVDERKARRGVNREVVMKQRPGRALDFFGLCSNCG